MRGTIWRKVRYVSYMMRNRLAAILLACVSVTVVHAAGSASYEVTLSSTAPAKWHVVAHFSSASILKMSDNWSLDVPGVSEGGWPALVHDIHAWDKSGVETKLVATGEKGWKCPSPAGIEKIAYDVDFGVLASSRWPAPREAAFADADNISTVGRALFVTSSDSGPVDVKFTLPPHWTAVVPFRQTGANTFRVSSTLDLTDNLLVFTRQFPEVITSRGFAVRLVAMGYWKEVKKELRRVVAAAISEYTRYLSVAQGEGYVVVLLPVLDSGGESYRSSFAVNGEQTPSTSNLADWGHLLAHEIFHYWNGWRIAGNDYASSQWLQEGFTEYAADIALLRVGVISLDDFCASLGRYVERYKKLETPMSRPGKHKGPPLYSGGALAAFCADMKVRDKTADKRTIADFWKEMDRLTDHGRRQYDWPLIKEALLATAAADWEAFYSLYIDERQELPFRAALASVGLRLIDGKVSVDPSPDAAALQRRRQLAPHG